MKSKPLCILVDDEESGLSALRDHIEDLNMLTIEKAFLDPDKFLVKIDELKAEIIFLDIEMPIEGIEVARKLKDKLIIFVSGMTERGYETFDVNPIDFVPKPIQQSRLKTAIEKVLEHTKRNNFVVKTQEAKKQEINTEEVYRIKTADEKRDKIISMISGKEIIAKNIRFEDLLNMLPSYFIQVNPSDIVNSNFITKKLDADTLGLVLPDSDRTIEIILGNSYKDSFFRQKPHLK